MSSTEERLALAEAKIAELQADLRAERDRTTTIRRQLEGAAHDAANLESRLVGIISKLEGSYQEHGPGKLTVDDIEVLLDVRGLHMNINSKISPRERVVFDRLYTLLDERLLVRRKA